MALGAGGDAGDRAIAEDVLVEAERKAATESEIRLAVREGMLPLDAYEKYGTF